MLSAPRSFSILHRFTLQRGKLETWMGQRVNIKPLPVLLVFTVASQVRYNRVINGDLLGKCLSMFIRDHNPKEFHSFSRNS